MRRVIMTLMLVIIMSFFTITNNGISYALEDDMKGAWITTVYNSDWPSNRSKGNIEEQKKEMINILDELKYTGINTVIFQVRPKGDALYNSSINPWSDVLTGTQGKNPGYDPLEFVVTEVHKRGMKVHAWLNPYRVTTSGTDISKLNSQHPARKNPSWVISYNGALFYNPELDEVKQHITDTVEEVVSNYDIDGIHFDDYFYPRNYPLPSGESKDGYIANSRRNHITNTIKMVSDKINSISSNIDFGVSPSGIWKNKSSDSSGSDTKGHESYYSDYADTRTWIKNNYIDYVVPQLYWEIGYSIADYSKLVSWWNNEVSGSNVNLYIGQGIYKDKVASEIYSQLELNQKYNEIDGSVFYTTSDILNNRGNCKDSIKLFYDNSQKLYYLDIFSFLGEDKVRSALEQLQHETGWYAEYHKMESKEPIYKIETGGFAGKSNLNSGLKLVKEITGLDAKYVHYGEYEGGSTIPLYRIETGGFIGEENVKSALKWLQDTTGWWATYERHGSNPDEYRIVTGAFGGEESVKEAAEWLKNNSGWWLQYNPTNEYIYVEGQPIYHIYIDNIAGKDNSEFIYNQIKSKTGWYMNNIFTKNYMYYYRIETGAFLGLENVKKQSENVKKQFNWYNEIRSR